MKDIEGGKRWTRGSGTYIAVLKAEIAHLKSKLNDEDTSVSILKTTISTLNLRVKELEQQA